MKNIKVNGKTIKQIKDGESYLMFLSDSKNKIDVNETVTSQIITFDSKETFINNLSVTESLIVEGELIIT